MPSPSSRYLSYGTLFLALAGWSCSSEDTPAGPTAAPEQSVTAAATYRVRDLGTLVPAGPVSHAYGINKAGVVVGASSINATLVTHAFVWENGVMKDLGTLAGANESQANAINTDGAIVGWSRNSAGNMRAVRWAAGKKRSLGTLGGLNSEARGINDFGVIVGWSETLSGQRHAFRWENGVMTDLGTMGGPTSSAEDINRDGAIVGWSQVASGERHAFRWRAGGFKDLGVKVGTFNAQFSRASAVNTQGQIVGILGPPPDAAGEEEDFTEGFIFHQDVMKLCSCSFRHPTTNVQDINANGIIVGWEEDARSDNPNDSEDAWVSENGTIALLPELASGDSGAESINQRGNIVGYSQGPSGRTHAVLWRRQ